MGNDRRETGKRGTRPFRVPANVHANWKECSRRSIDSANRPYF